MNCSKQTSVFALAALATSALSGCMTPEAAAQRDEAERAARAQYVASIPTCSTAKECEAKWSAARRWVLDHCGFRLQTVTADYMETYNVRDVASTAMWCRVTRSPISETVYRIELENGVNNLFALGGLAESRADFNAFVTSSWSSQ